MTSPFFNQSHYKYQVKIPRTKDEGRIVKLGKKRGEEGKEGEEEEEGEDGEEEEKDGEEGEE